MTKFNNDSSLWTLSRQTYPVRPSTESSMGKMWIRFPYLTSGHDWMETMSDKRTRKLLRTTRFIRIFSLGQVSSERTMQTVSLRLFPFNSTVSPRNNCSSSILAWERQTIELSSFVASSTRRRFGRSLRFKIAVAKSSFLLWKMMKQWQRLGSYSISRNSLESSEIQRFSSKFLRFRVSHGFF